MARKAIAAVLLLAIAAWAEMALAPMLAMHAGHMRPGHEMAADMPAEHAAHHHAEPAQIAAHRCCPRFHKAESEGLLEFAASIPGCDDPHSCCFRQGPQSVPAPVREVKTGDQRLTQELAAAAAAETSPTRAVAVLVVADRPLALSPLPEVFGMTLRI
jgi:hypothetical protein